MSFLVRLKIVQIMSVSQENKSNFFLSRKSNRQVLSQLPAWLALFKGWGKKYVN